MPYEHSAAHNKRQGKEVLMIVMVVSCVTKTKFGPNGLRSPSRHFLALRSSIMEKQDICKCYWLSPFTACQHYTAATPYTLPCHLRLRSRTLSPSTRRRGFPSTVPLV